MSVKTILVSQPKPETEKSPYFDLAEKYKLKIDFRPFIQVEGVNTKDFREQKVDLTKFTGVIFTSKTGVDHFFRIAEESRFKVPETMKYFCLSEAIAFYLQKYVVYRKRKIFYGKSTIAELAEILKKHKGENFLLPCSDILKQDIPATLTATNISYTKVVLYRTVAADLSDLSDVKYDLLVFFSPAGIESLFKNFPKFKQNTTCIAAFGPTTANAVLKHNLRLDIHAPQPAAPSMTMAIEQFIKNGSKK
ncbi:MAG: uroporphyrinogen-III synthase [Crocinitomicaceae bacterium]|jgi:uroporphyrinogen-III synthase|nr:uroporphyrinogen-III synthase [Crocinitomicaceae bacterium]